MKTSLLFALVSSCAIILSPATPARADGIRINSSSLVLAPGHMSGMIRVENDRAIPDVVQVSVFSFAGGMPSQNLSPTDDVLGVPAIFTIPPHGAQVVRIAMRGPNGSQDERAYRVRVEEIQSKYAATSGLSTLLQLNFPVYVEPIDTPEQTASWSMQRSSDSIKLTLSNRGNVHIRVRGWKLSDSSQDVVAQSKDDITVMPGQSNTWTVKEARSFSGPLNLHADGDVGPLTAVLQ